MTDFTEFAKSANLRHITFNGKDSLADFGILVTKNSTVNKVTPRVPTVSLPYRDGVLRCSPALGRLYYDARKLNYEFKIIGKDQQEVQNKILAVNAWLTSRGDDKIYDSVFKDYYFSDCECTSIDVTIQSYAGACAALLKANFNASPFLKTSNGGELV